MATYYVSFSHGVDSNNGKGPDPTDPVNRPWRTFTKVFASGTTVVAGDTVYFAPDIYYEGTGIAIVSGVFTSGTPTFFRGDPQNKQGFRTRDGLRVPAGVVWTTLRTAAEGQDTTPLSTADFLDTGGGANRSGMYFYNIAFEGAPTGTTNAVVNIALTNTDWLFQDCLFIGSVGVKFSPGAAATATTKAITFQGCEWYVNHAQLAATITAAPASPDIDINCLFHSNIVHGRATMAISLAPSGGNLAGGVRWKYCTFMSQNAVANTIFSSTALRVSTVVPCSIESCLTMGGEAVSAGTLGHYISLGNNRFYEGLADTNFTPLQSDVYGFMPRLKYRSLMKWGLIPPSSDFLGWEAGATASQKFSAGSSAVADFFGRTVRPWGAGPSIGAIESGLVIQDGTSKFTGGGPSSLAIYGAGERSYFVQVDPVPTTLTILTMSEAYVGTNYAQAILQDNPECGVTTATATATDATSQTLTIGPFTPTTFGVVELRVVSRNAGASGWTYFDVLTIS